MCDRISPVFLCEDSFYSPSYHTKGQLLLIYRDIRYIKGRNTTGNINGNATRQSHSSLLDEISGESIMHRASGWTNNS